MKKVKSRSHLKEIFQTTGGCKLSQEQMASVMRELVWRMAHLKDGCSDNDIIAELYAFFCETDGSYHPFFDAPINAEAFPHNLGGQDAFAYSLLKSWPIAVLFPFNNMRADLGTLDVIRGKVLDSQKVVKGIEKERGI